MSNNLFNNFFSKNINTSEKIKMINVFRLFFGMLPNDLPKDLFFPKLGVHIYNESKELKIKLYELFLNSKKEFDEYYKNKNKPVKNQIINNYIDVNDTPDYIYKKGTESINFNDFKKSRNLELRPMGIESPSIYLIFMYNTFTVFNSLLYNLYNDKNEQVKNIIKSSNSPILENGNVISEMLYDNRYAYNTHIINYRCKNKLSTGGNNFTINLMKESLIEREYPYYMTLDIQSFFPSIYTHNFNELKTNKLYSLLKNEYPKYKKIINSYLKFLDTYNMQCNEDETRGIVSGPLSSSISAELLSLGLYYEASHSGELEGLFNKVKYNRYVDDVIVFSKNSSTLYELYYKLGKLLQDYGLAFQNGKVHIKRGIYIPKAAHLLPVTKELPFLYNDKSLIIFIRNVNTFLDFKLCVKKLIIHKKFSTLKSLFTMMSNRQILFRPNTNVYNKWVLEKIFYEFLLKVIFMCPYLSVNIYSLIWHQIKKNVYHHYIQHLDDLNYDNLQYDLIIFNELISSLSYINKRFCGSVIQVWTYYLINVILNKLLEYKKLNIYNHNVNGLRRIFLRCYCKHNKANSLVLMTFISLYDKALDGRIYKKIIYRYKHDVYEYRKHNDTKTCPSICDTIMNSKWAFPIYKLHSICHINGDKTMGRIFQKNKMPHIVSNIISGLYKE